MFLTFHNNQDIIASVEFLPESFSRINCNNKKCIIEYDVINENKLQSIYEKMLSANILTYKFFITDERNIYFTSPKEVTNINFNLSIKSVENKIVVTEQIELNYE